MREIYKGHLFSLDNLDGGETIIQFSQRGPLHTPIPGPSCQEVIRALIARVTLLNEEIFWIGNEDIIRNLRMALSGFEARAILRKTEKGLKVESLPIGDDGHLLIGEQK